MQPSRRELVVSSLALGALGGLGVASPGDGDSDAAPQHASEGPVSAPLFRISLAQWSLHRAQRAGELEALDFPAYALREFGIDAVEYVSQFFADRAGDFAWLRDLRARADREGVRSLLIMVDGEGALGAKDGEERRRAIERHFKWVAASAFLGGHAIRVNVAGEGSREEHARLAADSLHRLADVAHDYGISILVENHGGPSSDGAWLADVMRRADHPGIGTLPDFGNFRIAEGVQYDRYQGIAELMPWARAVSAKSHDFDDAGEETGTDYARMLGIVLDAGYRGWIGIEYEGGRLPEVEGVRRTRDLLLKLRERFAAEGRR